MARKIKTGLETASCLFVTACGAGYSFSQAVSSPSLLGWIGWGWLGIACVAGFVAVCATATDDDVDESNGEGW